MFDVTNIRLTDMKVEILCHVIWILIRPLTKMISEVTVKVCCSNQRPDMIYWTGAEWLRPTYINLPAARQGPLSFKFPNSHATLRHLICLTDTSSSCLAVCRTLLAGYITVGQREGGTVLYCAQCTVHWALLDHSTVHSAVFISDQSTVHHCFLAFSN